MIHDLKCWPAPFASALDGSKVHEIRSCVDRDFNVGDVLHLREFEPGATPGHGGRWIGERPTPGAAWGATTLTMETVVGAYEEIQALKHHHPESEPLPRNLDGAYWSAFTGRVLDVVVTYVSRGPEWGLPAEMVVMSIRRKG